MADRGGTRPNEHLQQARLPAAPQAAAGQAISRTELADAVDELVLTRTGRITPVDGAYVGKPERGVYRRPNQRYPAALREILQAATDGGLGFAAPRRP